MLLSIALIFIIGLCFGTVFKKLRLPGLTGMIIAGIVLGPYGLNLLDTIILTVSKDIRQIALIIILIRAGLNLNIDDLKKVGRSALLMCFIPATFEMIGVVLLAPKLLSISIVDAAVLGSVLAAVSPAVVVPKMLHLQEKGYGVNKSIPQMIMTSASVDDIYVIVIFTALTGLAQGENLSPIVFFNIPVSIISGLIIGIIAGYILCIIFKRIHIRDSIKVLILLSVCFIFVTIENRLSGTFAISGLLGVMSMGALIQHRSQRLAKRLSLKFSKLWVAAELFLFVLVGATVDLTYVTAAGPSALLVLCGAMIFRMVGVFICVINTPLNIKERLFCMVAFSPKATVQAAIGGIPLALGLPCGNIVLTVAVLSILLTASLGAFGIDITHKRLLTKTDQ